MSKQRYLLFAGDFYPRGGGYDFRESFVFHRTAMEFRDFLLERGYDWAHVFDIKFMKVIN